MGDKNAVVLVTDAAMLPAAGFLATRLTRLNPRKDTDIILYSDWAEGLETASRIGVPAILRSAAFDRVHFGWADSSHWSKATYHYFFLPVPLSRQYRRIVCVDIDTYPISAGLFDLFELDLEGKAVAGVRSILTAFSRYFAGFRQNANLPFGCRWLNSGILVIDPSRYVALDIETKLLETMQQLGAPPINADEGILNAVLDGDWLELSPRFQVHFLLSHTEITEVYPPDLVHFAGPVKQWSTPSLAEGHPARTELAAYLAETPWSLYLERWDRRPSKMRRLSHRIALRFGLADRKREGARGFWAGRFGAGLAAPELHSYLRDTEFADVAQGLTRPRLDRLRG